MRGSILTAVTAAFIAASPAFAQEAQSPPAKADAASCVFEPDRSIFKPGASLRSDVRSWKTDPSLPLGMSLATGYVDDAPFVVSASLCTHFFVSVAMMPAISRDVEDRDRLTQLVGALAIVPGATPLNDEQWRTLKTAGKVAVETESFRLTYAYTGYDYTAVYSLSYQLF